MTQAKRKGASGRDRLSDADYRALGEFRRALRDFLAFSDRGAAEHDVSPQQHQAMLAVRAHSGPDPMSIGELAECLNVKHHSAVGMVDRMVDRGLLVRTPSPADRRRVQLELTPRARRILSDISARNLTALSGMSHSLSDLVRTVERLERSGVGSDAAKTQTAISTSPDRGAASRS